MGNMNNEEKVEKLELALAEAQMIAEDSDKKYDECARKLAMTEVNLERAVERAEDAEATVKELEEELKIVGKNMRELEVSENRALTAEEENDRTIRDLTNKLKISEKKASEYEMMSGKLMKDVERLEKQLDQAVSDMNDMNKLMEQTLEFFSSG